jgi:hypothetical protein
MPRVFDLACAMLAHHIQKNLQTEKKRDPQSKYNQPLSRDEDQKLREEFTTHMDCWRRECLDRELESMTY